MGHDNLVLESILARLRHCAPDGQHLADCPDNMLLAAYLDNRLPEEQQARFVAHLADCRHCRQVLTAIAVSLEISPDLNSWSIISEDSPRQADAMDPLVRFEMELSDMESALGIRPSKPETDTRPHIMVVDDDVIYLNALVSTEHRLGHPLYAGALSRPGC